MNRLSIPALGATLATFFGTVYVLCLVAAALAPAWPMHLIWPLLLPGFSANALGLLIGLVEVVAYGFFVAVIVVPVYRFFDRGAASGSVARA